jgi:TPR repeat protein
VPATAPAVDTQQVEALLARGDDMLATGDVSAARLFYQRAAELGSVAAATAVGQTYDPGILELLRVRGAPGDAQMAAEWYRKAIAAGDRQAEIRLKRLLARAPG